MILKIRIPRPHLPGPRGGMMALAATPAVAGASFHAVLADQMDDWVVQHTPRAAASIAPRPEQRDPKPTASGALTRAWSWLQTKCAQTATKRLRVSETVSLGEKRFVALVRVEDREFLIGGGSSGVSMLTPLETSRGSASALPGDIDIEEGRE
jgi:hypothetical protein